MTIRIFETFAGRIVKDLISRGSISNMKKSAKPKEILGRRPGRRISLREQYAELLKLREEVRKLTSSRINPQRQHQA
jgi:hypothetical protein